MAVKFSVCIPNYNSENFIAETIESALAQDVPPDQLEIIVSDNLSTDNSREVIKRYLPRVRLVERSVGLPPVEHWNACAAEGRGEYVILLHSDDTIDEGFLRVCGGVLDRQPEAQMVSCKARIIDAEGRLLKIQARPRTGEESPLTMLLRENVVVPPSLLVRRSFYTSSGYYNPDIVYCADHDLAVRGAAQNGLILLDEILCSYRRHNSNLGGDVAAKLFDIHHTPVAARMWAETLHLSDKSARRLQQHMLWNALLVTVCTLEAGGRRSSLQRLAAIRESFRIDTTGRLFFGALWLLGSVPGAWRLLRLITAVYRKLSYRK